MTIQRKLIIKTRCLLESLILLFIQTLKPIGKSLKNQTEFIKKRVARCRPIGLRTPDPIGLQSTESSSKSKAPDVIGSPKNSVEAQQVFHGRPMLSGQTTRLGVNNKLRLGFITRSGPQQKSLSRFCTRSGCTARFCWAKHPLLVSWLKSQIFGLWLFFC